MTEPLTRPKIDIVFPHVREALGPGVWDALTRACAGRPAEALPEAVAGLAGTPPHLSDLARIELALHELLSAPAPDPATRRALCVNPTLRLLELGWRGLDAIVAGGGDTPERGDVITLLYLPPGTRAPVVRDALEEDLLSLKIVLEGLDPAEVARTGGLPVGAIDLALARAVEAGILMRPPSLLVRTQVAEALFSDFQVASSFTLQWHITHACDLHCRHCYDRSARTMLPFERSIEILDELRAFALRHNVAPRVTFTGGNPFLHPRFLDLYRAAHERGFTVSVLGNPVARERIEGMLAVTMPDVYQVSLEGLAPRNDSIRGEGHFARTVAFLDTLGSLGVYRMVMLTLTRKNMADVISLARALGGLVETFHFNRLSMVGEGANLALPDPEAYRAFLEEYLDAREEIQSLGLKDGLLNILMEEGGEEPFGGCTGHGCGAAFNHLALLPDGEVHACRKFPSPVGNVLDASIDDIYQSDAARLYRTGCAACAGCRLRAVCGSCMAVTRGMGLDPHTTRDPFCFRLSRE